MSELLKKVRRLRLLSIVGVLLTGCSAMDFDRPTVAAAVDDSKATRTVTVYLVADPALGFVPTYQDRIVTAEPVTTSTVTRAEAKKTVQGINTIIVGDTCEGLSGKHPDLQSCKELDTTVRHYGVIENTASTDSEGFAVLELGPTVYRISTQTWQTAEDNKCSWSGSEILPVKSRVLKLPVLVFCE